MSTSLSVANTNNPVTPDNFNTYEQTCDTIPILRAFVGVTGMQVYVRGTAAIDDGGQGQFYWNAGIINPVDDNTNTIVPPSSTQGCWTRITSTANSPIPVTITGTNALVLMPLAGDPNITKYANYQLFTGVTAAASTGSVTAQYGALASLPVYLPSGAQAGAGSFSQGEFIMLAYVSSLNSGAGGFAVVSALASSSAASTSIVTPQGRLTLTSNTPIMTADVGSTGTIYYAPYVGGLIPIYNGTVFTNSTFSQLTLNLDSNSGHTGYQASGSVFDIFVFSNSGVVTIGTGPAWTSTTARGTGAGTTQIQLLNGIWTNANSITMKIDATATTVNVAANQATYVGTMFATGNGLTEAIFKPAAASGGSNNIIGIYNGYNRISQSSLSRDSTTSWTYSSNAWRAADNNINNRVSCVDGLQQSPIDVSYTCYVTSNTIDTGCAIGVNLNSTSAAPNLVANMTAAVSAHGQLTITSKENFYPQLGFYYMQAMEIAANGGASQQTFFAGGTTQYLLVTVQW